MTDKPFYIGIMSGTSADAIDVALVDFSNNQPTLLASHSKPLPVNIRQAIHRLARPGDNEIDLMGELDVELGQMFADAALMLIQKSGISPQQIVAIGSHGQTIRHRPPNSLKRAFTVQIGDPNHIAQRTKITTVADFRRRDMAAGGQGAPLVPAFHKAVFQSDLRDRVIVNIGGMANLTWLPTLGAASGFDIGPGNVLMDAWASRHISKPYDAGGAWAATGKPNDLLLRQLLNHPFFSLPAPKSTGREAFNLEWLMGILDKHPLPAADVQASLLTLTAKSIANDINRLSSEPLDVFVCGGGAYNSRLMDELKLLLPQASVASTEVLGVAPQWVEAMAFAWLAKQTMEHNPGNLRAVTGATSDVILGGVYFA